MKGCPSAPRFASSRASASESRLGLDSRASAAYAEHIAPFSSEAALLRRLDECEAASRLGRPSVVVVGLRA